MLNLDTSHGVLLVICLAVALGFEFVNGFHDTANAVATVIYTRSLRPWAAVIWSGVCNFAGVFLGGIAVAMSIIKLLPAELLAMGGTGQGFAMILALLLGAILWNVGTWYFGIPSSSSHTLIGSIIGVGLAHSLTPGHTFGSGVNWHKAGDVGLSLLISPMFGFSLAAILLVAALKLIPDPKLHEPVSGDKPPPGWIRAILITTCTGVSFAHGSNDGQKGVGLIMLILIATMPGAFSVNRHLHGHKLEAVRAAIADVEALAAKSEAADRKKLSVELEAVRKAIEGKATLNDVPEGERFALRKHVSSLDSAMGTLEKQSDVYGLVDLVKWKRSRSTIRSMIDYAPSWVLIAVAFALGLGTMVGWKRIVVTIGEKIGKEHLSYAQGAAAEIVAMCTIGVSAVAGLPVSTTHVLSSGIAGTMVAKRSGLQPKTVRSIGLAWVLTLPVTMLLSGTLFLILRKLF